MFAGFEVIRHLYILYTRDYVFVLCNYKIHTFYDVTFSQFGCFHIHASRQRRVSCSRSSFLLPPLSPVPTGRASSASCASSLKFSSLPATSRDRFFAESICDKNQQRPQGLSYVRRLYYVASHAIAGINSVHRETSRQEQVSGEHHVDVRDAVFVVRRAVVHKAQTALAVAIELAEVPLGANADRACWVICDATLYRFLHECFSIASLAMRCCSEHTTCDV